MTVGTCWGPCRRAVRKIVIVETQLCSEKLGIGPEKVYMFTSTPSLPLCLSMKISSLCRIHRLQP